MKKIVLKKLSSYDPSENSSKLVKIGEASQLLGISIDSLRRWEKKGWLKAIKTPGGTRLYDKEQLEKLNPNLKRGPKPMLSPLFQTKISQTPSYEALNNFAPISLHTDRHVLNTTDSLAVENNNESLSEAFKSELEAEELSIMNGLKKSLAYAGDNFKTLALTVLFLSALIFPLYLLSKYIGADQKALSLLNNIDNSSLVQKAKLSQTIADIFSPELSRKFFGKDPLGSPPGISNEKSLTEVNPASQRDLANLNGVKNLASRGSVLAESSPSASFLQINLDTQINGIASVSGNLTAPNIVYSVIPGTNITVTGDPQRPTISSSLNVSPATNTTLGIASFSSNNFTVNAGAVTLTNGSITGSQIASGTISNSNIANPSITINTGSGLTGGGAVSLGGSITISATGGSSSGVTSITGTSNQVIASASTGDVTLSLPQDIANASSPTFAGITLSGLNTAGGIIYTNGSGNLATSAQGTAGQCLVSGGAGGPTWTSCSSGGGGTVSGTGTQNTLAKWAAGGADIQDSQITDNGTTVTVGGTINVSGGTASRFVATDGSKNLVYSTTSSVLAATLTDETGSGKVVFDTSPTLVTPVLGVATATSINGLTITSTTGTLTVTNGKTLTVNDSTTLATDSITFGGTEVLALAAGKNVTFADAFTTSGANPLTLTTTGSTNVTLPTSGTLCNTSTCLTSSTGVTTATGTANQILVNGDTAAHSGAITLTLPSAITAPGSLTTTTSLSSGTTVTAGTGLTVTSGNAAITAGALTLNGVTRIANNGTGTFISGTVIGSQTFTTNNIVDSGALTIKSDTSSALTLDSGTTGNVNLGSGNNAKTVNIATGTAGNVINIGTDDTTADTIGVGSTKDSLTLGGTIKLNDGTASRFVLTDASKNLVYSGASSILAATLTDETGSGKVVFDTSPTLVTPVLGVATATSINKVTITAPATSATLTLADGSSLITTGNSLTLRTTGDTDVTFPTSGTLCNTSTCLTSGSGVTTATGTANQILVNGDTAAHSGAITLTLPSAITAPGSLTTTTSLSSGTTVTAGTGLTVTTGNAAITAGALTLGGTTRISNAGVGTFVTGTVIGSQTFTTNTITDSGALTINSTSTALNLQADGTPDVNIAGGSGATGCTVANASGNLNCSGNITGASTGTVGYWTRSGTTLSPATSNDVISVSGNAGNILTLASSATGAANKALNVSQTGATSGTDYGGYFSNTGAATTNIGLYSTATGASNNYAAIFDQGYVGIGTTTPTTSLHVLTADSSNNTSTNILTLSHDVSGTSDGGSKLLLHMDGSNASTTFTDSSGSVHTVTANGNAQLNTSTKKFGTASGAFDGTGDYLTTADSTDWDFAGGDFTIETWIDLNSAPASGFGMTVFSQDGGAATFAPVSVTISTARHIVVFASASGSSWDVLNGQDFGDASSLLTTGSFHHFAITRSGNSWRVFIDGTQLGGTVTAAGTLMNSSASVYIGGQYQSTSGSGGLNGYLDEMRVLKGTAAYTSNFTPETSAFTGSAASGIASGILFQNENAAGTMTSSGGISSVMTDVTDQNEIADLTFSTISNSGSQAAPSEKLRITGAGKVGIGDTTPDAMLEVLGTTEQLRLTYTDNSVDSRFTVDSSGNLTIDNTGTKTIVADDLQVSGNDILDSGATSRITLGSTTTLTNTTTVLSGTTTLTASSLATITSASTLGVSATTLNVGGGSAATIGTPSSNAALSIIPNGTGALNLATSNTGNVAVGNATGTFALTSNGGLNVTTGGALTGVASIDTIGTSATALTFAGGGTVTATSTALNLQNDGTVDVNIAGGSGATGCTVTNSSGDLTCTGNITGSGSGSIGYWTRTGTTLSTANAGDNVTVDGTLDANGIFTIGDGGDSGSLSSTTLDIDATGALQINSSGGAIGIGNDAVAQAINIGTGAAARTITTGNGTGATALAFTSGTGSQTFTSAVTNGTTTGSAFVFNASALTSGTALRLTSTSASGKLLDLNATNTSGTIVNLAYGASKTLSGDLTGVLVDLNSGNVDATNQNLTGGNFKIPTVTDTHTTGTKTLTGLLVNFGAGAGINQNGAGGTLEYVAGDFYTPALTQTAGTLNSYGTRVTTPATITTGGTAYGNYINATGVGAGTLSGVGISAITGGSGTEYALNIGSGWDAVLRVGSNTIINGSGVTQVVGGGTGAATLGSNGILYGNGTSAVGVTSAGTTGQVLIGNTGSAPSWGTISGSTCTDCVVTDPSSDQTIAPTGQGTTGLTVRQTSTASPTDDIFQITDSAGSTKYFWVDKDGNVSNAGTSSQTLTLTPLTNTTALTLVGTNVTSQPLQYINSKNSSATSGIVNLAYGAAQTLSGTVIGIRQDLSTNVTATNQSVTGESITLPAATNTSGTQAYTGISISGGALNENGGTATTFTGASITIPALTQTSGTLTAYGANITTPSSITTAGTAYGLNINASGVGAGTLNGINIGAITAGAGTENGLTIGSGWDTNLLFSDTTTRVAVADGGNITILDTAGNTLCTVTDSGTTGDLNCTGNITGGSTGTIGYWSRSGTTLSPATANDIVSIANTTTTGADLGITNTGVYTGTGIFNLAANSANTGVLANISGTGITTGKALSITGPGSTGVTSGATAGFVNIASDVGSGGTEGSLVYLAPDFSAGSATTGSGIKIAGTDTTAIGNTDYNIRSTLALTGNAAKTGYGVSSTVTSNSTTGDTLYSLHAAQTVTGIITTGQRTQYGVYSNPTNTANNTGGRTDVMGVYSAPSYLATGDTTGSQQNVFGFYSNASAGLNSGTGLINQYGLYVANGSSSTAGSSTKYAINLEGVTGADTNYAIYSNGGQSYFAGNIGIGGDDTPNAPLAVGDGTDELQVSSVGDITFVDANGGASITGPAGGVLLITAPSTALNLQSDGSIDVNIAGGSSATGCTVANTTGNLTCSGNITGSSSGTVGYWTRSGTTLSPATSGDNVTTSGNISTTSSGTLTIAGTSSLNGAVNLGDATSDDITFNGYVASNILPKTDDTYTLGDDTHRFKDLFLGGETLHIGTSTSDEAAISYTTSSNTLAINNTASGIINIGTSALAQTITMGNNTGATSLAFTSGTGSQTFTSSVVSGTTTTSAFVFNGSALTSGTGIYATSATLTTGKLAQLSTGSSNVFSSGTLLDMRSTSTGLTGTAGTGSLANLDWSPGSATVATGDLFALNIGTNGTTTGNLFNILDSGSSIFSVAETSFTTSLPTNFTAPGDVAIAYDINFTNPTSSFIKSAAPITIQSGETFNSSNLTLGTYNQGTIVLSAPVTTGTAVDLTNTGLTTGTMFNIASSNSSQTTGTALAIAQSGVTTGYTGSLVNITSSSTTGAATFLNLAANSSTAGTLAALSGDALTTGIGLAIDNGTSAMTTGSLLRVTAGGTGAIATNGIVGITHAGAYTSTSNVGLLNVSATGLVGTGTVVNITATNGSQVSDTLLNVAQTNVTTGYTGTVASFSTSGTTGSGAKLLDLAANAMTVGTVVNITSLAALTSGSALNISAAGTAYTGDLGKIELTGNSGSSLTGNALKVGITGTSASGSSTALMVTNGNTGASAYVARFNDDGTYTDSSPVVIDGSGNLGIGLTAPGFLLEVNGTARINGATTLGDASGDTVTSNAAAWTFANDTTVALSGGLNGINFDSDTLSIDAASNYVGIGTAAPTAFLHVKGQNVSARGQLTLEATDFTQMTMYNGASTEVGHYYHDISGNITHFGTNVAGGSIIFETGAAATGLTLSSAGAGTFVSTVKADGYVSHSGVGGAYQGNNINFQWSSPNLHAWVDTTDLGTITITSDQRNKTNITDITHTNGLEAIRALRPVTFNWNTPESAGDGTQYGFLAQQVREVLPDLVHNTGMITPNTPDGLLRLDYNGLFAPIVEAIQELDTKVTTIAPQNSLFTINSNGQAQLNNNISKITMTSDLAVTGSVSSGGYTIDANTINLYGALASVPVNSQNKVSLADAINALNSKSSAVSSQLSAIENKQASDSAVLAETKQLSEAAVAQAQSLDSKVASTSASLASLSQSISDLLAGFGGNATDSGNLDLTPPAQLIATDSAAFADLDVTHNLSTANLSALDATISGTLKSLGDTFLGNTTVAGDLTVDGTLSFTNGNSINALPVLYFQNSALASGVDFFNGLVTISKQGILAAKEVIADQFKVRENKSAGTGVLTAGQTEVAVLNDLTKTNSIVVVTPENLTNLPLVVTEKVAGAGFIVKVSSPQAQDIHFSYLIVGQEQAAN